MFHLGFYREQERASKFSQHTPHSVKYPCRTRSLAISKDAWIFARFHQLRNECFPHSKIYPCQASLSHTTKDDKDTYHFQLSIDFISRCRLEITKQIQNHHIIDGPIRWSTHQMNYCILKRHLQRMSPLRIHPGMVLTSDIPFPEGLRFRELRRTCTIKQNLMQYHNLLQ